MMVILAIHIIVLPLEGAIAGPDGKTGALDPDVGSLLAVDGPRVASAVSNRGTQNARFIQQAGHGRFLLAKFDVSPFFRSKPLVHDSCCIIMPSSQRSEATPATTDGARRDAFQGALRGGMGVVFRWVRPPAHPQHKHPLSGKVVLAACLLWWEAQ